MKAKTISQLKQDADAIFSKYIRLKYADPFDETECCVACGIKKHWKEMHNGHYESRSFNATRYHILNCHPECPKCNIFHEGNKPAYAIYLRRKYGNDVLEILHELANTPHQFTKEELINIINEYKLKVKKYGQ